MRSAKEMAEVGIPVTINMVLTSDLTDDLNDELGADVHAIGLLSDAALVSSDSPERLKKILQRNRELTERTGGILDNISEDQKNLRPGPFISICLSHLILKFTNLKKPLTL